MGRKRTNQSLRGASLTDFRGKATSSIAVRKCDLCTVIYVCYNRLWPFVRLCYRKRRGELEKRLFNDIISLIYISSGVKKIITAVLHAVSCTFTCIAMPVISGDVCVCVQTLAAPRP